MRTTIRLDDALLRQAKSMAAANGRSLNEFIVDAVRAAVARRTMKDAVPLPTFRGHGLMSGVNLDDSAALLDLMTDGDVATEQPRRVAEPSPSPRNHRKS